MFPNNPDVCVPLNTFFFLPILKFEHSDNSIYYESHKIIIKYINIIGW